MNWIATPIAIAMALTAAPALAGDQNRQHQVDAQHETMHTTRDRGDVSASTEKKTEERGRNSVLCSCQQDGKRASNAQLEQDFAESAQWPAF